MAASYEIAWAVARTPPSSGYFDPEDHPARTTAYTASEDIARMKRSPTLRSAPCSSTSLPPMVKGRPQGTIMKMRKAGTTARNGASMYMPISALRGLMASLKKSLSPSATVCSTPNGPARLGPIRLCMSARTLRSAQTLRMVTTRSRTKVAITLSSTIQNSAQVICPPRSLGPLHRCPVRPPPAG